MASGESPTVLQQRERTKDITDISRQAAETLVRDAERERGI